MKGLIFREMYLAKKNYIICAFSLLLVVILEVMVRLSINFGNLSKLEPGSLNDTDNITFYLFIFGIAAASYAVFLNDGAIVMSDIKCGWQTFSFTIPVSETRLVLVKYVIKLFWLVLIFVFSVLNALMVCGISGRPFDGLLVKVLLGIFALASAITFVYTPLMLKFRSSGVVSGIFMALFALVYFGSMSRVMAFLEEHGSEDEDAAAEALTAWLKDIANTVKPYVVPAGILLVICTFAAGFFASVRLLKRREK